MPFALLSALLYLEPFSHPVPSLFLLYPKLDIFPFPPPFRLQHATSSLLESQHNHSSATTSNYSGIFFPPPPHFTHARMKRYRLLAASMLFALFNFACFPTERKEGCCARNMVSAILKPGMVFRVQMLCIRDRKSFEMKKENAN